MRYSESRHIDDDALIVHVHVPRTAGTSLRLMLTQLFGAERCLMNYEGEIEGKTARFLDEVRCVSGHVGYGVHRHFTRAPTYVTAVRNPIDRYVSTYAAFLANPRHKYHAAASRYDINGFLSHVLESETPGLWNQLHNLQCRLICGEPDHRKAKAFIDDLYYLAAPVPEIDDMVRMLLSALGREDVVLPHANAGERVEAARDDRLCLSDRSIDMLMTSEQEDTLIFSYVQQAFARLRESFEPARKQGDARRSSGAAQVIPPKELRFMQESDDVFLSHANYLSDRVADFTRRFGGGEPRRLLDIGCGYGRLAYGLRAAGFAGRYVGFDILKRHIDWLARNFSAGPDDDRYRFDHVDIHNERYNPEGRKGVVPLPYENATFDCLVSLSVFTHLHEEEVQRYVRQLAPLLEEGGLWVTTFFCVPCGFTLEGQHEDATFPLVAQVSPHAYVHSVDEPLYVIAFTDDFLQRQFAQAGLEVVAQRKGRWCTPGNALELQDWFVLRKRGDWIAPSSAQPRRGAPCNICGSTHFGLGPNGRTAANGRAPRCLGCDSLERHRGVRRLFQAIPREFLAGRRALQFSADPSLDSRWFGSLEVSRFDGENSLDVQSIARADGSYDFLSLSHVLESVPDDRSGFDELCRILAPRGLMHISFGAPLSRSRTLDFEVPLHEWKAHHLYGRDLVERFGCERRQLHVIEVQATDPCTGIGEVVHLFTRDAADAARLRGWLADVGSLQAP